MRFVVTPLILLAACRSGDTAATQTSQAVSSAPFDAGTQEESAPADASGVNTESSLELPLPLPLPPYVEPPPVPFDAAKAFTDKLAIYAGGAGDLSISHVLLVSSVGRWSAGHIVSDVTVEHLSVVHGTTPPTQCTIFGGTVGADTEGSEWRADMTPGQHYYYFTRLKAGQWVQSDASFLPCEADGTIRYHGRTFTPTEIVAMSFRYSASSTPSIR